MKTLTIDYLKRNDLIIYEVIAGSHLFGLNVETSDEDFRGVFVLPNDMLLTSDYIEEVKDEKGDTVYYELNKFMKLLLECKPNAVEILFAPEECIRHMSDSFKIILENRDKFLNNSYVNTSIKFAESQITKATGLKKKINNKIERKGVLDFCYTNYKQGSINIVERLLLYGLKQEYCGLVALKNMRYSYGVYYDYWQHIQFEKLSFEEAISFSALFEKVSKTSILTEVVEDYANRTTIIQNLKYKGIVQDVEKSNDISVCQVPKEDKAIIDVMFFNKDAYSSHCKDYREYLDYLKKRNVQRYTDMNEHGQTYDGKNLLHMMRSLVICNEYVEDGKLNLNRRNIDRDYLLSIKKGLLNLEDVLIDGKVLIENLKKHQKTDELNEDVVKLSKTIILKIRK